IFGKICIRSSSSTTRYSLLWRQLLSSGSNDPVIQMRERNWARLPFYDPKGGMVALNKLSDEVAVWELPYNVASLRTNGLRRYREGRQCALFCYGVGQRLGIDVRYAESEEQDIDFVVRFERDGFLNFVPLQLKELVPEQVSNSASLQVEI